VAIQGATGFESIESLPQPDDSAIHLNDNSSISPMTPRQSGEMARQPADTSRSAPCCAGVAQTDASLDFLNRNWAALPASIRESILAIARAVVGAKGGAHE
jgi:hypothetical protein